ncbi:maker306, partial [Drosophila busckii]
MQALKLVVCLVVMWASVVFGAGCEFEGKQLKVGEWMQPKDKCLKLECKADGVAAMG